MSRRVTSQETVIHLGWDSLAAKVRGDKTNADRFGKKDLAEQWNEKNDFWIITYHLSVSHKTLLPPFQWITGNQQGRK